MIPTKDKASELTVLFSGVNRRLLRLKSSRLFYQAELFGEFKALTAQMMILKRWHQQLINQLIDDESAADFLMSLGNLADRLTSLEAKDSKN